MRSGQANLTKERSCSQVLRRMEPSRGALSDGISRISPGDGSFRNRLMTQPMTATRRMFAA